MKKIIITSVVVLFTGTLALCQNLPNSKNNTSTYIRTDYTDLSQPLIFIDTLATKASLMVTDPQDLKVIKHYNRATAPKIFGNKGKDGVVLVELAVAKQLSRLHEVLNHFNVSDTDRKLKVLLNKSVLVDPKLFLADLGQIEKVEVTPLDLTSVRHWSQNVNEMYINIVTVKQ